MALGNGLIGDEALADGGGLPLTAGGFLGPLARAQYSALLELRWRIFLNSLRSKLGAFEFGARTISYLIYGLMGVGLAFGAGGIAYGLASDRQWNYMPAVFWFVLLTWQVVPIMLASFQEQFNLGTMLRFPLSFKSFYFLYVVFGLSDVSTAIGTLCSAGILFGITVVRPDLFAFTLLVLIVFGAFNILLVRAVFAWIDRWLSQRKTREILAAFFMIFFLSFQLMNPAVWQHGRPTRGKHGRRGPDIQQIFESPWAHTANQIQQWLPPGLAGRAISSASARNPIDGIGLLAVLGVYALAASGVLGARLKAEYRGEDLSFAPAQSAVKAELKKPAQVQGASQPNAYTAADASAVSSSVVSAIFEKEFSSLLRSLPLLYAIGAPVLMVLVISGAFVRGNEAMHTPAFAFPLCLFFAQLGFHQLWGNSLGTEGAGVQLYFLSPTPFRTVLLAKNLFHAAIFVLVMFVASVLAIVRLGSPDEVILFMTAAWLLVVLSVNLAVGNIFSLTMPYKINPGRISRQRRSQGTALLSLLVQAGLVVVGALVYLLSSTIDMPLLAIPVFLALATVAALVWFRILGNSGNIANQRKDQLIAALTKADD